MRYDFQAAGEFVALRDGEILEIQTRQTPVSTAAPLQRLCGAVGLVAVNTAVAAKVNKRRVTLQPRLHGEPSLTVSNCASTASACACRKRASISATAGGLPRRWAADYGSIFPMARSAVTPGWWSA